MGETNKRKGRRAAVGRYKGTLLFLVGLGGALGFGWGVFPSLMYSSTQQPIQFNHKIHMDEGGMACADCHPFRDDGTFAGIPTVAQCAECHEEPIGESPQEKAFVEDYIAKGREVEWRVYSRQPMNAYFSHVAHVKNGKFTCEECHGDHGATTSVPPYQVNRISGYSRAVGNHEIAGRPVLPTEVMRMDTCSDCHEAHGRRSPCLECHK